MSISAHFTESSNSFKEMCGCEHLIGDIIASKQQRMPSLGRQLLLRGKAGACQDRRVVVYKLFIAFAECRRHGCLCLKVVMESRRSPMMACRIGEARHPGPARRRGGRHTHVEISIASVNITGAGSLNKLIQRGDVQADIWMVQEHKFPEEDRQLCLDAFADINMQVIFKPAVRTAKNGLSAGVLIAFSKHLIVRSHEEDPSIDPLEPMGGRLVHAALRMSGW